MKNRINISVSNSGYLHNENINGQDNTIVENINLAIQEINKYQNDKLSYEEKIYKKVNQNDLVCTTYEEIEEVKQMILSNYDVPYIYQSKIAYYYINVDRTYGDTLSEKEKYEYARIVMEEDKKRKNGQKVLFSTAILTNVENLNTGLNNPRFYGYYKYDGPCITFYNDDFPDYYFPLKKFSCEENKFGEKVIVEKDFTKEEKKEIISQVSNYYADIKKNSNDYSDFVINTLDDNLDSVCFIYPDGDRDEIFDCIGYTNYNGKRSKISIDVSILDTDYDEQLATYTHEITHSLDNACRGDLSDFSETREWKNIYNQVYEDYSDTGLLSDYSFTSPAEFLAESVSEFYANDTYSSSYNPNDLKAITIEVGGEEMTLYDYLDDYLDGDLTHSFSLPDFDLDNW